MGTLQRLIATWWWWCLIFLVVVVVVSRVKPRLSDDAASGA
jgi:hypothetical protein